jgi:hypothetical protein
MTHHPLHIKALNTKINYELSFCYRIFMLGKINTFCNIINPYDVRLYRS